MNNIDELEKLADAATPGPWYAGSDWVTADMEFNEVLLRLNSTNSSACGFDLAYIAAANPQTIKQLIALCRLQHEALSTANPGLGFVTEFEKALAAYEQMNGGE